MYVCLYVWMVMYVCLCVIITSKKLKKNIDVLFFYHLIVDDCKNIGGFFYLGWMYLMANQARHGQIFNKSGTKTCNGILCK